MCHGVCGYLDWFSQIYGSKLSSKFPRVLMVLNYFGHKIRPPSGNDRNREENVLLPNSKSWNYMCEELIRLTYPLTGALNSIRFKLRAMSLGLRQRSSWKCLKLHLQSPVKAQKIRLIVPCYNLYKLMLERSKWRPKFTKSMSRFGVVNWHKLHCLLEAVYLTKILFKISGFTR